ncbi:hypothetical protein LTR16_002080 [Cryomyces antarcticus]|uniref:Uncharacterized protein n=1 Tax=Cryomyces antarcticus TaxID=329879 RepID=A0ABR0LPR2_9PEZI|nr:hypothetical protein LTR39_001512 [Cryomyces antarcticus]KAK5018886.1 hypothetical protein LTR60_001312 [Cryomyces antarcticus]KAK5201611.1 hypothetical protein LTR16_002080 [Cryomyces antarcticus]
MPGLTNRPSAEHSLAQAPDNKARKSSLRRFSSITSFASPLNPFTSNPFARRRQTTETSFRSSTSTANDSDQVALLDVPDCRETSLILDSTTTAEPVELSLRDYDRVYTGLSWAPMPLAPPAPLPRSHTLSNLPLPSKAHKKPLPPSRSSIALPPAGKSMPNTVDRNRTSSQTKAPIQVMSFSRPRAAQRSNTQPVLLTIGEHVNQTGSRKPAMKENISRHAAKISSDDDAWNPPPSEESWMSLKYAAVPTTNKPQTTTCTGTHSKSRNNDKQTRAGEATRLYETAHEPLTRPLASHRWASEQGHRKRPSFGAEIKQHQLLSPRSPPTPPLPKTPLTAATVLGGKLKSKNNSGPVRTAEAISPCSERGTPTSIRGVDVDFYHKHVKIHQPQAMGYWCGRFSSTNDSFRGESFDVDERPTTSDAPAVANLSAADQQRHRRVLVHLHSLCTTDAARESFQEFQIQYAKVTKQPWIALPIPTPVGVRRDRADESDASTTGTTGTRKASFFDRLMGKGRKSSG